MKKIIVADDDEVLLKLICNYLGKSGYDATPAEDGSVALRMLQNIEFDLLITDIFMPNIEGMELIRRLRKLKPAMPIIAISGNRKLSDQYLDMSKKLGADIVVPKPIDFDSLLSAVGELID